MRLNKKGLTLIELIISVVLVTVVMLFMYRLLNDVNRENNDTSYAQKNQINRSEIIKEIEDDILAKKLSEIIDNSEDNVLNITFKFTDNTESVIKATSAVFRYKNTLGNERKWTIKEATINTQKVKVLTQNNASLLNNGINALLLAIEIYTDNDANRDCAKCTNNIVDDLIISYVGDNTLTNPPSCLGKGC